MRHHSPYTCPIRTTEKKREVLVVKTIAALVLFFIVLASLIYDANSAVLTLNQTEVTGNSVLPGEKLKEIVNMEISGKYLWAFPKNNLLLYPKSKIASNLLSKFPTIKKVDISASLGNVLSVSIEERKPFAVWCQSDEKEKCYFMDNLGFIYSEAPDFSGSAFFKYYGIVDSDPIGKTYKDIKTFVKLNSFIDSLKKINITPITLNIDENDDVFILVSSSGEIRFSLNDDLKTSFSNLQTVLNNLNTVVKTATSTSYKFQYIDLRFGDKVFVK